nr:MAG TPA: tailspike protein [Caudoviricetes sp.]
MADNIVKAEYLKAIDEDTNTEVLTQFIPPEPDGTDRGGITKQELEQIEQNKNDVNSLKEETAKKINKPLTTDDGKIPRAKDGQVEWVEVGQPTDEQTENAVTKWMNEHPEVTTTVQNGAITEEKINTVFLPYIKNDYVTPEMFGAVGDGVTDDSNAIEQALSNNKNIIMKSGATYKICRAIFPNATKIHIDGCGAKIIADDTFSYTKNECYAFFQFQVNAKNLTEFVVKNLDIDIKTNGILYGERVMGDERSCPIFRIKNTKTILIDNCNWVVMSDTGNRAIVWVDGVCDERVSITNSNFENKCAGNAGGVIAIRMRNDLKDITSFMANCSLITDSCDELYSIQNMGASNLYSTIESCVFINHGGFINNKSTKKTIIVATNHTGTGKLYMDINATKIEYDGQSTDLMNSALKLSSTTHAYQNITMRGCTISNPYGCAIEGAFSEQGSQEYLHININKCDIVGGKSILNDVIDSIGDIIITDCNIEGESYVSYFYPLNYTNRFIMKNSKVHFKNPEGILYVTNKKRHIVEICGNIYSADYISKAYGNDAIDPDAPNIDLEVIQNNVYVVQSTI